MAGIFITFEGTEGCGKSTHIRRLATCLEDEGHTVRTLREPGGTKSGEEVRELLKHGPDNLTPETELLLMNASRAQLVREIIRPALAAGEVVLCDRFYDSTTVYQAAGRGLNADRVRAVIDFAVGETHPDLTLLLQIPLEISEKRRAKRYDSDRFESEDREFFERIEAGYAALSKTDPDRIKAIDANRPLENVQSDIMVAVSTALKIADSR
ncbi:MAG: dTMP kinase [Verrucomicrobiota bacterium]|jgi:dTMP kinase|nr:dTMP kinase [Verrucomicrobiota bacterium]